MLKTPYNQLLFYITFITGICEIICFPGYLHQYIKFSSSIKDFPRLQETQDSNIFIVLASQKQISESSKGFEGETPQNQDSPESTAQDKSWGIALMDKNHVAIQHHHASVSEMVPSRHKGTRHKGISSYFCAKNHLPAQLHRMALGQRLCTRQRSLLWAIMGVPHIFILHLPGPLHAAQGKYGLFSDLCAGKTLNTTLGKVLKGKLKEKALPHRRAVNTSLV